MKVWSALLAMVRVVGEAPDAPLRLVDRALGGDRTATRVLVRRLMPVIRATLAAHLNRIYRRRTAWGDVDDYAQEVWLRLWSDSGRRLRAFDPQRGLSIESYVAMVAHRELQNMLRREAALKRGGDRTAAAPEAVDTLRATAPDPERQLAIRDEGQALGAWLTERLSARGLWIFRCLYDDGRSAAETAQVVGCTPQVVYNWQHRIRALAREFRLAQP